MLELSGLHAVHRSNQFRPIESRVQKLSNLHLARAIAQEQVGGQLQKPQEITSCNIRTTKTKRAKREQEWIQDFQDSLISQIGDKASKPLWVVSTRPPTSDQVVNYKTLQGLRLTKLSNGEFSPMRTSKIAFNQQMVRRLGTMSSVDDSQDDKPSHRVIYALANLKVGINPKILEE